MSKILLINSVVRECAPPNNVPLGPLYLAAVLELAGHEVDVCDMNALRTIDPNRERWLKEFRRPYDFIGLSGLIVTYKEQRRYLDYIMDNYDAFGKPTLISGGGLATSVADFAFRQMPELDVLVLGEGEMTMLDIANGKSRWFTDGIVFKVNEHGRMWTEPRGLVSDLDTLPFPAWEKVPVEIYLRNAIWGNKAANSSGIDYVAKCSMNMVVSRGCTHNCHFCASSIMGKKYRMRSVENVIAEIRELKERYDIDFVGFVDDNSTAIKSWTVQFCAELIKADLQVRWGCSARVNQVDPELLELMKEAGCVWIGFGIESGSPEILKRMNKKADPEQAAEAIRQTREAGIFANGTFICGYPNETADDLRMTAAFMRQNNCLNSMFFATPYPGTQLYDEAKPKILEKYGDLDSYISSLGDATDFLVNLSEMPDEELKEMRSFAMKGEPF